MSHGKYSYTYKINAGLLFDCLVNELKLNDYHIEEADRVEMILRLEKGGILTGLFGGDHKFLVMDIDYGEEDPEQCFIHVSIKSKKLSDAKSEIENILESCIRKIEKKQKYAEHFEKSPPEVAVKEIILREIVRVPCPYCGTFVDQTLTECPKCGGALRWK